VGEGDGGPLKANRKLRGSDLLVRSLEKKISQFSKQKKNGSTILLKKWEFWTNLLFECPRVNIRK